MTKSQSITFQIFFIIEIFQILLKSFNEDSNEYLLVEYIIQLCKDVSNANYKDTINENTYSHLPYHKQYRYRSKYLHLLPLQIQNKIQVKKK